MAWTNDMRLSAGGIQDGRRMNDLERAGRSKEVTYFTSRPSGMRSKVGSSYHLSGLQGQQWPQWRPRLWSEQGSERTSTKEEEDTEDFAGMSGTWVPRETREGHLGYPWKGWELGWRRGHQNESPWDEWWPGSVKGMNCIKDVMRLPWGSQGRVVVSEADEERRRKAKTLTDPQRLGAERVGSLTWSTQGVLRCLPCSQHRLSWTL